jgi:hypothetical protein
MQIGVDDVVTGVRIGKLLEKAKKNFEKEITSLLQINIMHLRRNVQHGGNVKEK